VFEENLFFPRVIALFSLSSGGIFHLLVGSAAIFLPSFNRSRLPHSYVSDPTSVAFSPALYLASFPLVGNVFPE